ncbi:MAG: hypothetical protein [Microviridae sp.]|nr:MAG: hypothetical protein [Microviridae sp.]
MAKRGGERHRGGEGRELSGYSRDPIVDASRPRYDGSDVPRGIARQSILSSQTRPSRAPQTKVLSRDGSPPLGRATYAELVEEARSFGLFQPEPQRWRDVAIAQEAARAVALANSRAQVAENERLAMEMRVDPQMAPSSQSSYRAGWRAPSLENSNAVLPRGTPDGCKPRPKSNSPRKGGGGRKRFIPWC